MRAHNEPSYLGLRVDMPVIIAYGSVKEQKGLVQNRVSNFGQYCPFKSLKSKRLRAKFLGYLNWSCFRTKKIHQVFDLVLPSH